VTLSLLNLTANGVTTDTLSEVDTRFIDASESKYSATIAELVRQDTKVTQTQPDGMTVIQWAAYHDGQQTGRLLINANCQADATTRKEVTPLSIAWQPALTPTSRRPGTKIGGWSHLQTIWIVSLWAGLVEWDRMLRQRLGSRSLKRSYW